jgi:hypothetical protein
MEDMTRARLGILDIRKVVAGTAKADITEHKEVDTGTSTGHRVDTDMPMRRATRCAPPPSYSFLST